MDRITGDAMTLMRQASMTAHTYMIDGIRSVDESFGEGYAKDHPELVSAFIQTCAMDYATAVLASVVQDVSELIKRD